MVYKCCAPGCRGNYDRNSPKVHTFKFPDDEQLRQKWLNFIKREKSFKVTKHTRLCEQHFKPEDIVKYEKIFDRKKGIFVENTLQHPYLKTGVVPLLLPNCPKYCSKEISTRKSLEDRLNEKEDEILLRCIADSLKIHEQYEKENCFSNLNEFRECLKKKSSLFKPNNWNIIDNENEIVFVQFTREPVMKVICSVAIDNDCVVRSFNDVMELDKFRAKLNSFDPFEKLLNDVWSLHCNANNSSGDVEFRVKNYISVIENALHEIETLVPDEQSKAIYYLIEQVQFISVHPSRYRYSTNLMVLASIFHSISPHAYNFVRSSKLVMLPHPKTVSKVCAKYNHLDPLKEQNEAGFLGYVKQRYNQVSEKERLVMLLMDEIHLKPYLDYKGGNIVGAAYNTDQVAKTAFVFMIKSFMSKFKEVAHILPVKTITGDQLHTFLMKILKELHEIGFKVLCILSDNNAINSKAISLFTSPPCLQIMYSHPFTKDISLFFLFDSVHIMKCVRNNWLNKKDMEQTFIFPTFDVPSNSDGDFPEYNTEKENSDKCLATFGAIKKLYYKEENQLVKYAYTLNLKSLFPSNLERQNVRFVMNVFNDFVKQGLLNFSEIPNSSSTAQFIEIMSNWWSVVNTKTLFKGVRRRNDLENPMAVENEPYNYLCHFLDWLNRWKNMDQRYSLTRETMTAIIQTTEALLKLCDYCCKYLGMEFILPGKIQTDSLEAHFGSYRTMAGTQYLITLRQIFEVEKKNRLQNYLPLTFSSKYFGNYFSATTA